ncbi:MAG: acetolactate synthase, partial [Gammaproteobacteria bacterium]|nr:acetolactate synthase [Gammaproteobacteria bacterium]
GSLQEMDHVAVMKPITKWADACYDTKRIPDYIEMGIRHAVSGNPGPAFLEIPMDVMMGEAEWDDVRMPDIRTTPRMRVPAPSDVDAALAILSKAERPVMMVGTSAKWSNAASAVQGFIEQTHIPTFVNGMGRGMVKPGTPELLNRVRKEAMSQCDVFVCAGVLLDFRLGYGKTIPANAKIIQLDIEDTLIGTNRSPSAAVVGNLAATFDAMHDALAGGAPDFSAWRDRLAAREAELEAAFAKELNSDEVPIDPLRLCREIRDFVADRDLIIIGDGGDIVAQASKVLPVPAENCWMDPGPLGTLGVGMPFALAAQLACPDKRVLIIYGDGAFGLNGFEYDTAVRFNLPIVGIVGNDGAWGQMVRPQAATYGAERVIATKLNYTRYDQIVAAMGGHGEHCERPEEIRPALERAFASGKPALINVNMRQDVITGMKGSTYV